MDPWMITPDERAMHAGQFGSLNPAAGFIDGNGARGFFMQSGLPPMVLAQVGNARIFPSRVILLKGPDIPLILLHVQSGGVLSSVECFCKVPFEGPHNLHIAVETKHGER